jgi:hypothetical protein
VLALVSALPTFPAPIIPIFTCFPPLVAALASLRLVVEEEFPSDPFVIERPTRGPSVAWVESFVSSPAARGRFGTILAAMTSGDAVVTHQSQDRVLRCA